MGHRTEHHKDHDHTPENHNDDSIGEKLVAENIVMLTRTVESLNETIQMLVQKTASMAYHIVASEEIIAELIDMNGLNLANVNARIRERFDTGTDNPGTARLAVDVAATIATILPRR